MIILKVLRVDPIKSKLVQQIPLPALNITSATFGGENYDELWITSAANNSAEENALYPEGGNVFRIRNLGVAGLTNLEVKF